MDSDTSHKKSSKSVLKILHLFWTFASIAIIGVLGFMLYKEKNKGTNIPAAELGKLPGVEYTEGKKGEQPLDPETQKTIDNVVARVVELAKIEGDAKPTVGRVANVDNLKKENPEFYENAQNGDYLVIYPNVVFLYSPTGDNIVKVAEVSAKQNTEEGSATE